MLGAVHEEQVAVVQLAEIAFLANALTGCHQPCGRAPGPATVSGGEHGLYHGRIGGSAGLAQSEVWRGIRDRGRAGGSPSLAYLEFCSLPQENACEDEACTHALSVPGCALDDIEYLRQANPALDRRITADYIRAERQALSPEEFGRERAGWWDKPEGVGELIGAELAADPGDEGDHALDVRGDRLQVPGHRPGPRLHDVAKALAVGEGAHHGGDQVDQL